MHHDSSKEEVNLNVTETNNVSDSFKDTLATFDEKCLLLLGEPRKTTLCELLNHLDLL